MIARVSRLVAAVAMLGLLPALVIRPQSINAAVFPAVREEVLSGWNYQFTVSQEGEDYIVDYQYSRTTNADVKSAASAMRSETVKLVQQGKPFKAQIVFSHPLSIAEFRVFVDATGISPTQSIVRGFDSNSRTVKAGIPPIWSVDANGVQLVGLPAPGNDPFDESALNRLTMDASGKSKFSIAGVIGTITLLDGTTYSKVSTDARVFAIDVMEQVLTDMILQQAPDTPVGKIHVRDSLLYTAMENTGLIGTTPQH